MMLFNEQDYIDAEEAIQTELHGSSKDEIANWLFWNPEFELTKKQIMDLAEKYGNPEAEKVR